MATARCKVLQELRAAVQHGAVVQAAAAAAGDAREQRLKEARAALARASLLFARLKHVHRETYQQVEHARQASQAAKERLDGLTMQLQGRFYERLLMRAQVNLCRAHERTSTATLELAPEQLFLATAPQLAPLKDDSSSAEVNQYTQYRLNFELSHRKRLCEQCTELRARKNAFAEMLQSKQRFVSSLPLHLARLQKETQEITLHLSLPTFPQHTAAFLLPPPLYTLYTNLWAYINAKEPDVNIRIADRKQDSGANNELLNTHSVTMEFCSDAGNTKETRTLSFTFDLTRNSDAPSSGSAPAASAIILVTMTASSSSTYPPAFGPAAALECLFPGDAGRSVTGFNNGRARAFKWAQCVAGLADIVDKCGVQLPSHSCVPAIIQRIKARQRGLHSLSVQLAYLAKNIVPVQHLATFLKSNTVLQSWTEIQETQNVPPPATPSPELRSSRPVVELVSCHTVAEATEDGELPTALPAPMPAAPALPVTAVPTVASPTPEGQTRRAFRAVFARDNAACSCPPHAMSHGTACTCGHTHIQGTVFLEGAVELTPEYPLRAPQWRLHVVRSARELTSSAPPPTVVSPSTHSPPVFRITAAMLGRTTTHPAVATPAPAAVPAPQPVPHQRHATFDNAVKRLEVHINTLGEELASNEKRHDMLLSHQMRKIQACFDMYMESELCSAVSHSTAGVHTPLVLAVGARFGRDRHPPFGQLM
eukprot:TRINITY_DN1852_c0_g1_i1.p1 TRINITY_DN1852_c0_g1~~TRINITY_DN1852_c0_g1_i1.p1  ORF type:complete len:709 (-),score=176.96 TRINITY_DN1852_c0_g1_i1:1122-3248(-)